MLLKLLIGPGPHKLYEFENILPRLPLPLLQQTCTKSVASCSHNAGLFPVSEKNYTV